MKTLFCDIVPHSPDHVFHDQMGIPTSTKILTAILLCGFGVSALADPTTPLPRSGKSCPTGYYKSGDYCVPRNDATLPAIERRGSSCPSGYRKSGDYCIANKSDAPRVIETEGNSCPSGYYRSGKYCKER